MLVTVSSKSLGRCYDGTYTFAFQFLLTLELRHNPSILELFRLEFPV